MNGISKFPMMSMHEQSFLTHSVKNFDFSLVLMSTSTSFEPAELSLNDDGIAENILHWYF